jgi:hypothetical protein
MVHGLTELAFLPPGLIDSYSQALLARARRAARPIEKCPPLTRFALERGSDDLLDLWPVLRVATALLSSSPAQLS